MSYINPAPDATVGRTDQGVDFSAAPGTSILAIIREKLVAILPNWYLGQPLLNFQELDANNKPTGIYNYVAEQINKGRDRIGQIFQQGQPVGTFAASGTGIEAGFSTKSGATLARATTGYTEGAATPAGQQYRSLVVNSKARARTFNSVPTYVPMQYRSWVRQAAKGTGLSPAIVAAQIQLESGFSPSATSPAGAEGIAQFEPGTWSGLHIGGSPYQPSAALQGYTKYMNSLLQQYGGNVRNALAAYNAGSANIAAGYGYADTILANAGVGSSTTASPVGNGPSGGIVRPGGGNANSSQQSSVFSAYQQLDDAQRTAPTGGGGIIGDVFNGAAWFIGGPLDLAWQGFQGIIGGPGTVINDATSFFSFIATILNPLNWLRAVEFLTGMFLIWFGLKTTIQNANRSSMRRAQRGGPYNAVAPSAGRQGEGTFKKTAKKVAKAAAVA